ncbi:MAG: hypothetical protein P4L59_19730 [Desulfosporosinus sp.]|nr:hypothetical protein [Desulfosporosinus sp.]
MWVYDSPVGKMIIKYDSKENRYALIINGESLGNYNSAIAAANNVYMHVTGYYEWDILDGQVDVPHDIYEWEKITG